MNSNSPGTDIRPVGSDIRIGEELIGEGRVLRAAELALLSCQGYGEVLVRRKPRVAVLSTGNELVSNPSQELTYGQVRGKSSANFWVCFQFLGSLFPADTRSV